MEIPLIVLLFIGIINLTRLTLGKRMGKISAKNFGILVFLMISVVSTGFMMLDFFPELEPLINETLTTMPHSKESYIFYITASFTMVASAVILTIIYLSKHSYIKKDIPAWLISWIIPILTFKQIINF